MSIITIHDALLEADSWRQTAARYRKRALANGGRWRKRCRLLEEQLDDVNERAADLAEKVTTLEADLEDRPSRAASEALKRQLADAMKQAENERAAARLLEQRLKTEREHQERAFKHAERRCSE